MSLNSVFRVRLLRGCVRMPPRISLNGPLMEWSRGSLGDNREYCRGRIFESMSTSWELSSKELKSLGMGLARALDEDAAMGNKW